MVKIRYQSKDFADRKRKRTIVAAIMFVLAAAAWLTTLSQITYLKFMNIDKVNVYFDSNEVSPVLERFATEAMSGSYMGIFSKSNAFLYPKHEIEKTVASSTPLIGRVEVRRDGLRTLNITISERIPEAVVCDDLPDLNDVAYSSDKCYLVDRNAYIYKKVQAGHMPDNLNIYYIPSMPGPDVIGTFATSSRKFIEIQNIVSELIFNRIKVSSVMLSDTNTYEIYAFNPGSESLVVIHMSESQDLKEQKDNLIAFWNKMVSDARSKGKMIEWNEIKLQYPPNVYSRTAEPIEK